MLYINFARKLPYLKQGRAFNIFNKKFFSNVKMTSTEEVVFESKEDKELRLEDELYYFEKEWKKLVQDKLEKKQDYPSPDLSVHQEREVEVLVNKASHLNLIEKEYFEHCLSNIFNKISSTTPGKPNVFNIRRMPQIAANNEQHNPNAGTRDEIISYLAPFIASGYFSGGAGGAQPPQASQAAAAPSSAEEAKAKEPEKLVNLK